MEAFPADAGGRAPSLTEDPALGLSHRAKMEILFAVMLGLFLGALDQTIVGPALPTIVGAAVRQRPLHLGRHDLPAHEHHQRAVLGQAVRPLRAQADLHDRHHHLPVGSALSGLSQNMAMLILFRGIQGVGAGALFPVALSIIGDLFTPAGARPYQGLFGAVFGVAFVAGPLIGGFLTENSSAGI